MTSREARLAAPKLLPGIAAVTWARVVLWLWVISIACFVLGFVFEFVSPLKHVVPFPGFALIVPAVVITVVLQLSSLTGLPHEKAEVRAGYTTLPRKYVNLDQLDPATGAVIRKAGDEYLPRSRANREGNSIPNDTLVLRPSIWKRIAPAVLGVVASTVFILVIYYLFGQLSNGRFAVYLVVLVAVVLIYAFSVVLGSVGVRRKLLTLRVAAPNEFAFIFGSARGVTSGLQALIPVDETPPPLLTRSRQASASGSGLTFWQGTPPQVVATLPWSKVISVQQDTVQVGRSTIPSVTVTFRDDDPDEVVALPLMNAEANYLPLRSAAEVRWIVWELNLLRTSKTSARLI